MLIAIIVFIILCILLYTWYEFHSKLKLHIDLKNPKLSKDLKLIKKYLKTSDGLKISSWFMPVKNPKAVLILVDGYKETNEDKIRMFGHAEYLRKAGYSTLLLDLRSFGESEGDKITFGINEWKEVEAAYDYMKALTENKNKKIGFLGISMGGVISIITKGVTGKGDFIIASTPYANFDSLFNFRIRKRGLPSFLFLPFLKLAAILELGFDYEQYSPLNMIKKIHVPILITSAKKDLKVNSTDAKTLYDAANKPTEYWKADTSHRIFKDNPEEFKKTVLSFLEKYV
ncbi:MAG: alpha/beta hydrolase [Candidatus Levybacteria bacterium]|nr:alpha/beta hydrolase [Candidatus Levybacteria bacterium]